MRLTSSAGILLAQLVVAVRKAYQQGVSEQQLVIAIVVTTASTSISALPVHTIC